MQRNPTCSLCTQVHLAVRATWRSKTDAASVPNAQNARSCRSCALCTRNVRSRERIGKADGGIVMSPTLCRSPEDVVILAAQLAFLRAEMAAKRSQPMAFLVTTPSSSVVTGRGARLRDLRDTLSDACEEALRTHPTWPTIPWVDRLAVIMLAEAVISTGAPVRYRAARDHFRRALESFEPATLPVTETDISALASRLVECRLVHAPYDFDRGVAAFVPICIPLEALHAT